MATVYIEPRPKGRDGAVIQNYVVETEGDQILHTSATQEAAIDWAQKARHSPIHVARVRHLTDKRIPDHWRKV